MKRIHLAWLVAVLLLCSPGLCAAQAEHGSHAGHGGPAEQESHVPAFFDAKPTIQSVRSGPWGDPGIWRPARVPGADDVAVIEPGHVVRLTGSGGQARVLGVRGTLRVEPEAAVTLRVETLLVRETGTLQIGPVEAGSSVRVVFRDAPLDPADKTQMGHGLIVLGRASISGAAKTAFLRLVEEPLAGQKELQLSEPPRGWRAGDKLVLPDSRHERMNWKWWYAPERGKHPWRGDQDFQWEERRITSVRGNRVTLDQPLRFDHPGARDSRGALRFLPHVANLTRNVSFESENPAGVRAHGIVTDRGFGDFRWCAFVGMGRTTVEPVDDKTNPVGRYPFHRHHNNVAPDKSGHAGYLVGAVVDGSPRWGVTIHGSDATLVRDTIAYNCAGAGFVTEDGSESFNTFERCFALRSLGRQGEAAKRDHPSDMAFGGTGFWFRAGNNEVRECVAASTVSEGFLYWSYASPEIWLPLFPGGRRGVEGESVRVSASYHKVPFRGFADNEAYGVMHTGATFGVVPTSTAGPFVAWHVRCGFNEFLSGKIILRDSVFVGSPGKAMVAYGNGANFGPVEMKNCVFENLTAERGLPD